MTAYYSLIRPDVGARVTINGTDFGIVTEDCGDGPVTVRWPVGISSVENPRLLQVIG